jgi:hypothetical protein
MFQSVALDKASESKTGAFSEQKDQMHPHLEGNASVLRGRGHIFCG